MSDDVLEKARQLLREAKPRATQGESPSVPMPTIQIGAIHGGHNTVATAPIHIHNHQIHSRVKVVVLPGPEHISDVQKVRQARTTLASTRKMLVASLAVLAVAVVVGAVGLAAHKFALERDAAIAQSERRLR